jgi:hypothetical protein
MSEDFGVRKKFNSGEDWNGRMESMAREKPMVL